MKDILISDVVCATNGKVDPNCSNTDDYISNITTSSKDVQRGSLFIAIRGGHNFVQEAIDKGAVCCLLEKEVDVKSDGVTLIYVEDTVSAMIEFAKFYRSLFNVPAVAITGSNGKTSTKDLVASVLSQKYNVLKTEGNLNNEIGVPMTIFNLRDHHEMLVVEMGMNHAGEIERLVSIVEPNVAIISNIGVAHIEHLGSKEGILKAKLEITEGIKEGGTLILNGEDEMLSLVKDSNYSDIEILRYGRSPEVDYTIGNVKLNGIEGTTFDVVFGEREAESYEINYGGIFMVQNALSAIICGEHFDLDYDEIYKGLKDFKLTSGRIEKIELNCGGTLINDAYNANPDSMKAGLDMLVDSGLNGDRATVVLGDMFELGETSSKMHREIGAYLGEKGFTNVIFCGDLMKHAFDELNHCGVVSTYLKTVDEILPELEKRGIDKSTIIYLKASNGMKFKGVVEAIKEKY